ncbi:crossover junction endodeoxyribonuclease RuvC [candidate division KSB1 bacterium]|nr:crossover junction endodeoxyribonuclease RuvC [candidate division KSB1 bacterium]
MIVAGVDPGIQNTGIAALEMNKGSIEPVTFENIQTKKDDPFEIRLQTIYENVFKFLKSYQPEIVAFEEIFYSRNVKVALKMGHARGVALLAAAKANIPIKEYSPREVKLSVTGNGNASKHQVQQMICRLLNLSSVPSTYDISDAMAVAFCLCQRIKFEKLIEK